MKAVACILIISLCGTLAAAPEKSNDEPKRDKRGYLTGGALNSAYDYGYSGYGYGDVTGYSGYPSYGYTGYPSLEYSGQYGYSGYPAVVNQAPLVSKVVSAPETLYAAPYASAANEDWW